MPKIFISYAREDDEPFVKKLHNDLALEFDVWWDREAMESRGRTFLQVIRDAIAAADSLLLVVGPAAVQSEYVRAEWEFAFDACKVITPILRLGDYTLLRGPLTRLHTPDFRDTRSYEEALSELVRILKMPIPPLGVLHSVNALPPHFLPRPEVISRIKENVLADVSRPCVITSAKQTAALQGMGGIGKSVIAAAFARSCDTRRTFGDGIIWLEFGRHAHPLRNIVRVATALADEPQNYSDHKNVGKFLTKLLAEKNCLIILDDIWDLQQAEPFLNALGPRCRLLITTRDAGLVNALGAQEQRLDVLNDRAALELLASWSEQPLNTLPTEASAVAHECDNLPFGLAVCGAMVRDGVPWSDLLHALRKADLSFLERRLPNYRYASVLKSLDVSVKALGSVDPTAERHFMEVAVFAANAIIPEETLMTLWLHTNDIEEHRARRLIVELGNRALLRLEGEFPNRRISLHDLQHDYLRVAQQNLVPLHERLLSAYRSKCDNDWASGPSDGYFFENLPYHLTEAGKQNELRVLLTDFRWLMAKLANTDADALVADYLLLTERQPVKEWENFFRQNLHILRRGNRHWPADRILLQLATEHADDSSLTKAADAYIAATNFELTWARDAYRAPHVKRSPCLRVLEGHTEHVAGTLLVSPNRLISWASEWGSHDHSPRLWDLQSGELLKIYLGHTRDISNMMLLPDGRVLSSAFDRTIRIWDAESGESLEVIESNTYDIVGLLPQNRLVCWSGETRAALIILDLDTKQVLATVSCPKDYVEISHGAVLLEGDRLLIWFGKQLELWNTRSYSRTAIMPGHTSSIFRAVPLPDNRVVTTSADDTLRVWDSTSGQHHVTLTGHTDSVWGVLPLADKRLLSWSADGTLRVWTLNVDSRGLDQVTVFSGHTQGVRGALELSGGRLVSWSEDHTLRFWDLHTGRALKVLSGHKGGVSEVLLLANGRLVSKSRNGFNGDYTLRLWDADTGLALATFEGHRREVEGIRLLPDGNILSWSWDHTLRIWDANFEETAAESDDLRWPEKDLKGVVVGKNGRAVSWPDISHRLEIAPTLQVWDTDSGALVSNLTGHKWWIEGALCLANNRIVSWDWGTVAGLWDGVSGRLIARLEHKHVVKGAKELHDERILSWDYNGRIYFWNSKSGKLLKVLELPYQYGKSAVRLLPDGRLLAWNVCLKMWDPDSYALLSTMDGHQGEIKDVQFLSNGRILSTSPWEVCLWEHSGKLVAKFALEHYYIDGARELPNGRILTWERGGALRIWNADSGTLVTTLEGQGSSLSDVLVLPEGRLLTWSKGKSTMRLWDANTSQPITDLNVPRGSPENILSLPGRRILCWTKHGQDLWLWDADSGNLVATLQGHRWFVSGAAALPNGNAISWSLDETIRLWNGQSGECLDWSSEDQAPFLHPDWLAARSRITTNGMRLIQGNLVGWARRSIAGISLNQPGGPCIAAWNSDDGLEAHELTSEGMLVVSQKNGRVCFLKLFHNRKRIDLAKANQLLN